MYFMGRIVVNLSETINFALNKTTLYLWIQTI